MVWKEEGGKRREERARGPKKEKRHGEGQAWVAQKGKELQGAVGLALT